MHEPRLEDVSSTDWSKLTIGQMWDVLSGVDQAPAVEQAAGWVDAFEVLDGHRRRLQEYRDLIAQTWRGATADAFLHKVDGLMGAVTTMRDAAIANEGVLPHLSASVAEARERLAPIHEQWKASQPPAGNVPARPDPHPETAPNGTQDQLHRQAIGVMTTFSSRVVEGYRAVKIPPQYTPHVEPGFINHSALTSGSTGSGSGATVHHAPLRPPSASTSLASTGPALADGVARPTGSGANRVRSSPAVSTSGGPQPMVGKIIGMVPAVFGEPSVEVTGPRTPDWSTRAGRVLPPGGVINAPFENPEPRSPAIGAPRANPVGGVVGPRTGRETEGMFASPVGGAGSHTGNQRSVTRNPSHDTDEHWPRPKGVSPVITSSGEEPVHDPGPTIGLPRKRRDR